MADGQGSDVDHGAGARLSRVRRAIGGVSTAAKKAILPRAAIERVSRYLQISRGPPSRIPLV